MKLGLGALALGVCVAAQAAAPVISSFGKNGVLICTNLVPGSVASVEWAPSVTGPWTNNWAGLDSVTADSSGMIQVSVPMFYRVRGFAGGTNPPPTDMVLIPAGSFIRGDTFSNEGDASELPTNTVTVSAFYMDKYEVTKTLWDTVYLWATNHGYSFEYGADGKAANHPAQNVSWYDAVKWCNARSEKEGRTPAYYTSAAQTNVYRSAEVDVGNTWVKWNAGYRLPTEAEWEKAARGGSNAHRFPWADADIITHNRANYFSDAVYAYDVSSTRGFHPTFDTGDYPFTSPVGTFAANGYGLYDMAGNVYEWCWDWFSNTYYSPPQTPSTDSRGPTSGQYRVLRGGSWYVPAYDSRVANRGWGPPQYPYDVNGFRTVLPAGQ